MHDVFISYSREEHAKAVAIKTALEELDRSVFIDHAITPGDRWRDSIQEELNHADVVIVLWSESSAESLWVLDEAAKAAQLGKLLPVQLDGAQLPAPFEHLQCSSLIDWNGSRDHHSLVLLVKRVTERLGTSTAYGVEPVEPGDAVDRHHLHLIDTTWRYSKKDGEFNDGREYYHLHVILFGHSSTLDRVERVIYRLPEWPQSHGDLEKRIKERDARSECFRHKDLANGYSVIQAEVQVAGQPEGSPRVIHLSRFVIPGEQGPYLDRLIEGANARPDLPVR